MTLNSERTCKIVRMYLRGPTTKVVKRGLTLDQAMSHCLNPKTVSRWATSKRARAHTKTHGAWFDGWDWE